MIGSPPRPGTSVNSVATIRMPRSRAARTSGASRSGSAAMAGLALSGAAVGAVAMQEIVLQIAENERAGRRRCIRRAPRSDCRARRSRPTRPGSITVVASGCSRIAGPAIVASAGSSSRAHTRGVAPAAVEPDRARPEPWPCRATRTGRARTPRSRTPAGGRSPRRAATRCASRGRAAGG